MAEGIGHMFLQLILAIVCIPLAILLSFLPRPPDTVIFVGIICLIAFVVGLLLLVLLNGLPSRTLRISRQAIILTDINAIRTKERRMDTSGARIRTVHFDFFERLFSFDMFSTTTAYHIEVFRSGETFLFPCVNETEQRQILAAIKEFGVGDVR